MGERREEGANKPGNPQLMGSSHSLAVASQIKATANAPVSPQVLMDYARQHGQCSARCVRACANADVFIYL